MHAFLTPTNCIIMKSRLLLTSLLLLTVSFLYAQDLSKTETAIKNVIEDETHVLLECPSTHKYRSREEILPIINTATERAVSLRKNTGIYLPRSEPSGLGSYTQY